MAQVYLNLHEERKKFLDPLVLPDDLYVEQWLENGLRKRAARSNTYPKIYECPLELGDEIVFPDLTLLSVRRRKTVYLEHCGGMDNPEYANRTVEKIQNYERFGFYLGDQLLITMETKDTPINIENVRRMLKKYLL